MNTRPAIDQYSDILFSLGKLYQSKGDKNSAIFCFKQLAEQGWVEAQFELAACYDTSDDIGAKQAFFWYQCAANRGHIPALYQVGIFYADGIGVEVNSKSAFRNFEIAAIGGHLEAHFELASCYDTGFGIAKNKRIAFELYQKIAKHHHSEAQYDLAHCYEKGKGTNKNITLALQWYEESGKKSHDALFKIAMIYLKGKRVKTNHQLAYEYLQKASDRGNIEAFHWVNKNIAINAAFIFSRLENSPDYYLPCFIPSPYIQKDLNCGSIAFAGGVNFTGHLPYVLFPSKRHKIKAIKKAIINADQFENNDHDIVLACLKNKVPIQYRSNGPQFSIYSFEALAAYYNIPHCKAIVFKKLDGSDYSEEAYREKICKTLRENKVLIVSCDSFFYMLTRAKGLHAHWVLVLGYWQDALDGQYYIAVSHSGRICRWSIHDLYESNKQLPIINPHKKDEDLSRFRFSFFQIPNVGKHRFYDSQQIINEGYNPF